MKPDRILEEVWKAKDDLGKRFGYDIHRMAEHFRSGEDIPFKKRKSLKKNRVRKVVSRERSPIRPCEKLPQEPAGHHGNGH